MERSLNAILAEINTQLNTVSFSSSLTTYALCYQQTKDGKTFPILNQGQGQGAVIHWNDTYPLRAYHRQLAPIAETVDTNKGVGRRSVKMREYQMRCVFIGTRNLLTIAGHEDNENFARQIAKVFPRALSGGEYIKVGDMEVDKQTVYNEEYAGIDMKHLPLDGIAFWIDYTIGAKVCQPAKVLPTVVTGTERDLNTILQNINTQIKTVSFGSSITAYELCALQTKDGRTFPVLNQGAGQGKIIDWDDRETLRIYHRMIAPIQNEVDEDQGVGARSLKVRVYFMRCVAIGTRKALTIAEFEDNEDFARAVVNVFPAALAGNEAVVISDIETRKHVVYSEEFADVKMQHLSLDGIAFYIDYTIGSKVCFPQKGLFAPVAKDYTLSIDENTANSTFVHQVLILGGTPPYTVSITAGNGLGGFAINSLNGTITVADSTQLDYETTPSFALSILVVDANGLTDTATITINLNDVSEGLSPLSPTFWLDATDTDEQTYTGEDTKSRLVSSITEKGTLAKTVTENGALGDEWAYNGEGVYSDLNSNNSVSGDLTSFKFLHDGSDFTIYALVKPLEQYGAVNYIFATSNLTSGPGIALRYSTNRRIQLVIRNASGFPINILSANNVWTVNTYHLFKAVKSGNTVTLYVDGVSVGSGTSSSYSTANQQQDLRFDCSENYIKHIAFWNSALSSADQTTAETFLNSEKTDTVTVTDANVYIMAGQSNASGQGLNSEIAAELNGSVGAEIYNSTIISSASYWDDLAISHGDVEGQIGAVHGFEMRFGKNMNDFNSNCWINSYGPGGTDLETDWLPPSGTNYTSWKGMVLHSFRELTHVFRKNVVIRGFIWMQGEADARDTVNNANYYQANLETLIKAVADDIIADGWDMTKCRFTIERIRNADPTYDATAVAAVRAAQAYVGDNFLTDFAAYASKIKSTRWVDTDSYGLNVDNIHYSAAGLDSMGTELDNYYDDFTSE